jgi:hypothetical protein
VLERFSSFDGACGDAGIFQHGRVMAALLSMLIFIALRGIVKIRLL